MTLVRRGYTTPEQARAFLDADESHPPSRLRLDGGGRSSAIRAAIAAGERITVHGDFDVDGVCATTIMVSTLRELGADCDWLIPDRIADGYGLSAANVERLAARGTKLLLTVDCGITAVAEVALARELGHRGRSSPTTIRPATSCRIARSCTRNSAATRSQRSAEPRLRGSWPALGGVGRGLRTPRERLGPARRLHDLDLVALATVADVVPLVGENRALVKRGLAEMRRARRPGLRALMEAAKCEPTRLDEGDLAFRLAPRINAAGRLYRADAGVELLLTEDEARAEEIAAELSRANSERRATRARGRRRRRGGAPRAAGGAARSARPGPRRRGLAPGGDRDRRLAAGRAPPPAGGRRLARRGGGRARLGAQHPRLRPARRARGLLRAPGRLRRPPRRRRAVAAGREASTPSARPSPPTPTAVLGPEDLRRTERIDAMVGGVGLGLDLAEELGRLAPFGMGNPGVRLMVPVGPGPRRAARWGRRASTPASASTAAPTARSASPSAAPSLGVGEEEPVDAAVRLEVNHWNGAVEPRVVLRELYPLEDGSREAAPARLHRATARPRSGGGASRPSSPATPPTRGRRRGASRPMGRQSSGRRGGRSCAGAGSATVTIAELVSSGAGVLAVCADASRRAALAGGATGLARFNGGAGADRLRPLRRRERWTAC